MKKILLIIPIVLTLAFVSCQKIERQYLKDVDKKMIPYQLGDTVCFVDDKDESVELIVTSIEDMWDIEDDAFSETWEQYRKVDLRSEISDWGLELRALGGMNFRYMTIVLLPPGLQISIIYDLMGNFVHLQEGYYGKQYIYDSMLIGNRIYHDVVESYSWSYANPGVIPDSTQCCYSKTYGILQIKRRGKTLLQRRS